MGSKWRKVKLAIGINMCVQVPQAVEHSSSSSDPPATTSSDCVSSANHSSASRSLTLTPSSSSFRLSRSKSKHYKGTCAICLISMKAGQGHAIFTAECSHSFHFHCIATNVKHGNHICPICRAIWKEVPFTYPGSSSSGISGRSGSSGRSGIFQRIPSQQVSISRSNSSIRNIPEPAMFDDDEVLDQQTSITPITNEVDHSIISTMEIRTYPEVSAVSKSDSHDNFFVLINLKAPPRSGIEQNNDTNNTNSSSPLAQNSCAPIDLVTVLDVSGSMSGTKIELVKQAMGFVIQNLTSSDRLSIVAFSSTARRVFPLKKMNDAGRREALEAVNSLVPCGGTNIGEGLMKGVKVFVDRRWKNPVGSIILLSDGQDTCGGIDRSDVRPYYQTLVPYSIHRSNFDGLHIPVHAFGFGADHDPISMHTMSDISGGTFSFIETGDVIQDAFAQCLGGLLSVVVQEVKVEVGCVHPSLQFSSVKAGSYQTSLTDNARMATIKVGDLYAEEERDILVTINVPVDRSSDEMPLLIVKGVYRDLITKKMVGFGDNNEVKIPRPDVASDVVLSIEVDRQRNRLRAAEAMAMAKVRGEGGDLAGAVASLERFQAALSETMSAKAGDPLCVSLSAEIKEMMDRMANQRVYQQSGRSYVLSGLSSHSTQRATARGDSTESTSFIHAYRTPSMIDMVTRSQTMLLRTPLSGSSTHRSTRSCSDQQRRR